MQVEVSSHQDVDLIKACVDCMPGLKEIRINLERGAMIDNYPVHASFQTTEERLQKWTEYLGVNVILSE